MLITDNRARELVDLWRGRLKIPPAYEIKVALASLQGSNGELEWSHACWQCTMRLDYDLTEEKLESMVVHELMHIWFFEMNEMWRHVLDQYVPRGVREREDWSFDDIENRIINLLVALILARWSAEGSAEAGIGK